MIKYLWEWIRSWDLGITIKAGFISIGLLFLAWFITCRRGIASKKNRCFVMTLSITLPAVAIVISNADNFFYNNPTFYYYKRELKIFDLSFYIVAVNGTSVREKK